MPPPKPTALPPSLCAALGPLARVRAAHSALSVLTCALAGTLGVAWLLVGLAEFGFGAYSAQLLLAMGAVALLGACAVLGAYVAGLRANPRATLRFARQVWPDGHSALGTALAAAHDTLAPCASPTLLALHLERLAASLGSRPWAQAAQRRRRRAWLLLGGVVVGGACISLALAARCPRGRAFFVAALHHARPVLVAEGDILGATSVSVAPPNYTRRAPYTVALGPQLRALGGSTIKISAHARTPGVIGAELTRNLAEDIDKTALAWRQDAHGAATATLTLDANVALHIYVDERDGLRRYARAPIELVALDNEPPRVALAAPVDHEELGPREPLAVRWEAEDDLGCVRAEVLLFGGGQSVVVPSSIEHDTRHETARCRGAASIASTTLDLVSAEQLQVAVKVYDVAADANHAGTSPTHTVRRTSPQAHHRLLLERERETFLQWVDWLAADQPEPFDKGPSMPQALDDALVSTTALSAALDDDTLAEPHERLAWRNALHHAQKARITFGTAAQRPVVRRTTLEADVLYLDDMLAHSGLALAREGAQALKDAQQQLRQLVSQLGQTDDKMVREKLMAQLQALAQKLNEVMQRMREVRQSVGHEEQNVDAAGHEGLQEALEQLAEAVERGDAKSAAEQLGALDNLLDQLTSSLDESDAHMGESRYSELRERMAHAERDAQALAREQQALADELERADAQQRRQEAAALQDPNQQQRKGGMAPNQSAALAGRQQKLGRRLASLAEELDALGQSAPILGESERAALGAAQEHLEASEAQLRGQQLGEAAGRARLGGESLERLGHALGQSSKQPGGMPLPAGSQPRRNARSQGGADGHDKVDIKTEEMQKTRAELREKIRQAARERAAPRYEKEVRDFYDELMR